MFSSITSMNHSHALIVANAPYGMTIVLGVFLSLLVIGAAVGAIYSIKMAARTKSEEELTKREAIQKVAEGTLSVEDAERLINPKKKKGWF